MNSSGDRELRKIVKSPFGCQECKRRKIKCTDIAKDNQQDILKTLPACNNCVRANKEDACVYLDLEEQRLLRKIRKLQRNFAKDEDIDSRDIIREYIRGDKSVDELQNQVDALPPKPKKKKTKKVDEVVSDHFEHTPEILNNNFDWNYGLDDLMKSIINIGLPEQEPMQEIEVDYNSQYNAFSHMMNSALPAVDVEDNHEALEVDFVTAVVNPISVHKHVRKELTWEHIEKELTDNQQKLEITTIDIKNFHNFYHHVSYWIFPFDKISKGESTINYIVFDYILNKISGKYHHYKLLKDPLVLIILALSAEYMNLVKDVHDSEKTLTEKYANAALQILNSKISNMANDERLLKANIGSLTITILLIVIYTSSENGGGWKKHHLAAKVIYQKYIIALSKENDDNSSECTTSTSEDKSSYKGSTMIIQEENLFKLFKQWFPTFDLLASATTAERGVLSTADYDLLFKEDFAFMNENSFGIDADNCEGCKSYNVTADFYCFNERNEIYNVFQGCGDVLTKLLVKLLDDIDTKGKLGNPDINKFYSIMEELSKCREFYLRKNDNGLLLDQNLEKQLFEEKGNGIFKINGKYYSIFDMSHQLHTALVNIIIFQKFSINEVNLNGFIKQSLQEIKLIFQQLFLEKSSENSKCYSDANVLYNKIMEVTNNNSKGLSTLFFENPSAKNLLQTRESETYTLLMIFSSVQMYALSLTPDVEDYIEERTKVIGYCQLLHTEIGSTGGLSSCLNFIKIWKTFDEDPTSYENLINLQSLSDKSVPFI